MMPDTTPFEPVAHTDEIPEGGKKLVRVGGRAVLLVRSGLSGDDGAAPPATVLESRERTTPPATTA